MRNIIVPENVSTDGWVGFGFSEGFIVSGFTVSGSTVGDGNLEPTTHRMTKTICNNIDYWQKGIEQDRCPMAMQNFSY